MGRCRQAVNCCIEAVRWFPVILLMVAIIWGYYAYVYHLCIVTVQNTIQRVFYLIFFHIFLGLFLWSYFKTIFAPLHKPPDAFFVPSDVLEELIEAKDDHKMCDTILQRYADQNQLSLRTRAFDGVLRFCEKCQCIKPDRAHHCSICSQCVLKFDHHCPWVNTCVNWHNYKFFLLFLGYGLIFCTYVFCTDMPYFIQFWRSFGGAFRAGQFHLIFMIFISGMFGISLSCLFFYHLYLTSKNRSTVGKRGNLIYYWLQNRFELQYLKVDKVIKMPLITEFEPITERFLFWIGQCVPHKNRFELSPDVLHTFLILAHGFSSLLSIGTYNFSRGDGVNFGRWSQSVHYSLLESRILVDDEDSEEDVI